MICPPIPYRVKRTSKPNAQGKYNIKDVYGGYLCNEDLSTSNLFKLITTIAESKFRLDFAPVYANVVDSLNALMKQPFQVNIH